MDECEKVNTYADKKKERGKRGFSLPPVPLGVPMPTVRPPEKKEDDKESCIRHGRQDGV